VHGRQYTSHGLYKSTLYSINKVRDVPVR
jgi:hypothetical protein